MQHAELAPQVALTTLDGENVTPPLIPFRQIVLKVNQRCNLGCPNCYFFEHADQSWRDKPPYMSDAVIDQTAFRMAEHATEHDLPDWDVVIHGGEPLLGGPGRAVRVAQRLRAVMPDLDFNIRVQTNGVSLTPPVLDVLGENGIRVGVSLNGDEAGNIGRPFKGGKSSYPFVEKALKLLQSDAYRDIYDSILCTIDLDNEPVQTYRHLREFNSPEIRFLLPHGNWVTPPPEFDGLRGPTPYADWLIKVFNEWMLSSGDVATPPDATRIGIRLFDAIIRGHMDEPSHAESVGLTPSTLVVIETDGSIEQTDALKTVAQGAAATGLDVFRNPFDDALRHPGIVARQIGLAALSDACRLECPVVNICGGGLYPHRYGPDGNLKHPSVYSGDLRKLIDHIGGVIGPALAARSRE